MSKRAAPPPDAKDAASTREARLAAALRANLRRRKAARKPAAKPETPE